MKSRSCPQDFIPLPSEEGRLRPCQGGEVRQQKYIEGVPHPFWVFRVKGCAITMTVTAWGIRGGLKCKVLAVLQQAASIMTLDLYFLSGLTVL